MAIDLEVAVIGAGVVGSATALAFARRGVSVALLEAEREPGLGASGANSGILHTGFDSVPGELETELILRSAELREGVLAALDVPFVRCGAAVVALDANQRVTLGGLAANARRNGVPATLEGDRTLRVAGEAITDPLLYTRALAAASARLGASVRTGFRVASVQRAVGGLRLSSATNESLACRAAVNCAGVHADAVARLAGDDSFEIYPRKGEFLVFDPPPGQALEGILLPVPTKRTKGVLVFPTWDGKVVAGPTAVDQSDKHDRTVRREAAGEILPKAAVMWPPLEGAEPIASYAGLRPAGRDVNYLIAPSDVCPELVNVAAIRSTGLTASLGIAERVCAIVERLGVPLEAERPLERAPGPPPTGEPWWRRAAGRAA